MSSCLWGKVEKLKPPIKSLDLSSVPYLYNFWKVTNSFKYIIKQVFKARALFDLPIFNSTQLA